MRNRNKTNYRILRQMEKMVNHLIKLHSGLSKNIQDIEGSNGHWFSQLDDFKSELNERITEMENV